MFLLGGAPGGKGEGRGRSNVSIHSFHTIGTEHLLWRGTGSGVGNTAVNRIDVALLVGLPFQGGEVSVYEQEET